MLVYFTSYFALVLLFQKVNFGLIVLLFSGIYVAP